MRFPQVWGRFPQTWGWFPQTWGWFPQTWGEEDFFQGDVQRIIHIWLIYPANNPNSLKNHISSNDRAVSDFRKHVKACLFYQCSGDR
jgi:hypothetical protein